MVYNYLVTLKNGKEYKVESELAIRDFINDSMPKTMYDLKFNHLKLNDNTSVAILGSEITSIEYYVLTNTNK